MDIHKVLELLPHRYPFVMVDKIIEVKKGESIVCMKNLSFNEPFFQGHFPGNPVMPGVLMLEAMAQASGLLYLLSLDEANSSQYDQYFAGIDKARFKKIVSPGDQLYLHCDFIKRKRDIWKLSCEAKVNDEVACVADILVFNKERE